MIPIELFPLAIASKLEAEEPDFSILLRLSTTLVDRIPSSKLTPSFYEYFETSIVKFTSQGLFLIEDAGSSNSLRKFI